MRDALLPLVRRYRGRLLSNRAVLAAVVAYALFLIAAAFRLLIVWRGRPIDSPDEAAQMIRVLGWEAVNTVATVSYGLAIIFGASWLASDVSTGTIFSYLARPISRNRLFLAASAAALSLILAVETLLAGAYVTVLAFAGGAPDAALVLALAAETLDRILAFACCAALAARTSPAIAVCAYLATLLATGIGFSTVIPSWLAPWTRAVVSWLPLSGLDHRIVRDAALRSVESIGPVAEAMLLRLVWIVVLLWLGTVAFRRRELAPRI